MKKNFSLIKNVFLVISLTFALVAVSLFSTSTAYAKNQTITVKTQKELKKALNDKSAKVIVIKTTKAKNFKISNKKYNKQLVVSAPKAKVVNKGTFTSVQIIKCKKYTGSDDYLLIPETPVENPPATGTDKLTSDSKSVFEFTKNLGIGINLGNTFEACGSWINGSSVTNYETAWGAPVTTAAMLKGMKKSGFNTVRIPVAWSNMMSKDGKYTIDPNYIKRVKEAVDYAINADMYVILNDHYDGGWWGQFGSANENTRKEAMKHYEAIWTQIADAFGDYDDRLIFESANEELGNSLNASIGADGYADSNGKAGILTENEKFEVTNTINQKFVDIIRGSKKKNNATRYLLIAGFNTDIDHTTDMRFEMPKDTIASHLIVSVHYYAPFNYALNEEKGCANSWGTDAEKKEMITTLSKVVNRFCDNGYPVIIGEYAVCGNKATGKRKENRAEFYEYLCTYALDNGMVPVLWDIEYGEGPTFDTYERKTGSMVYKDEADMFLRMSKKAAQNKPYEPKEHDLKLTYKGTIDFGEWQGCSLVNKYDSNTLSPSYNGQCVIISSIDWSSYNKPVLTISGSNMSADSVKVSLGFNDAAIMDNAYWYQFDFNKKKDEKTFTKTEKAVFNLSSYKIQKTDNIYLQFQYGLKGTADITITIDEGK